MERLRVGRNRVDDDDDELPAAPPLQPFPVLPLSPLASPPSPPSPPRTIHNLNFPSGEMYTGQLAAGEPSSVSDLSMESPSAASSEPDPPSVSSASPEHPMRHGSSSAGSSSTGSQLHGVGVLHHTDGTMYKGEFRRGAKHGLGLTVFSNGDKHVGEYRNNLFDGHGTYTSGDGNLTYVGGFVAGEFDGSGTIRAWGDAATKPLNLHSAVAASAALVRGSTVAAAAAAVNLPSSRPSSTVPLGNDMASDVSDASERGSHGPAPEPRKLRVEDFASGRKSTGTFIHRRTPSEGDWRKSSFLGRAARKDNRRPGRSFLTRSPARRSVSLAGKDV